MKQVYVAVADAGQRARIVEELRREGCNVIEQPTGFHVLQAIADVIEGTTDQVPAKIVVDERARGCTGTSLAAGLRALGVHIPIELVGETPASATAA